MKCQNCFVNEADQVVEGIEICSGCYVDFTTTQYGGKRVWKEGTEKYRNLYQNRESFNKYEILKAKIRLLRVDTETIKVLQEMLTLIKRNE